MSSTGIRDKVQRFLSVQQPSQFRYIVRFEVTKLARLDGGVSLDARVTLGSPFLPDSPRLKVVFTRATEVKVGDLNGTVGCLVEIRDVSDRGLEDITYRVVEEEAGCFSLNCHDFDFEVEVEN